jgi:hypothetical protein
MEKRRIGDLAECSVLAPSSQVKGGVTNRKLRQIYLKKFFFYQFLKTIYFIKLTLYCINL